MDRQMLLDHLAIAERHVAQGDGLLRRQREIIEELTSDGHHEAAERAKRLLAQFEDMQALHVADRDRIRKEVAENSN